MQHPASKPVSDYQRLAKRLDRRYAASKSWDELPLQRAPGRPRRGEKREPLVVHSLKLTAGEWDALRAAAKAHHLTVNALVRTVLRPATLPKMIKIAGLS